MFEPSEKLKRLPPYIFSRISKLKQEAFQKNLDVIDLVMGNPDLPTPAEIVDQFCETVKNHPRTHRYPQAKGMPKFRKAVCDWYDQRFGVKLNPDKEALALVGSKEGVAHLCMAFLNPGDGVLVPNPGYPVYNNGVILAGGEVLDLPLLPENNFLPDLGKIPQDMVKKAKMMFFNYPNNPTAAVVDGLDFFKEVAQFGKKNNIIICHDNAYSEVTFDGYDAPSFLQAPGAKDIGIEFHSCSKSYNMAGWRIGFVVGNETVIAALEKFKSFLDYGVFTAIQLAAVTALNNSQKFVKPTVEIYQRRRDKFVQGLNKLGWPVSLPKATMYLWAPLPPGFEKMGSLEFCEFLLTETGVAVTPGIGFGTHGEGYVRMSLVTHDNRFHDALLRIKKFLKTVRA
ncbi:MAG: LL-diaminopimelate aminotransferase [Elusimicrobiota bacterium]